MGVYHFHPLTLGLALRLMMSCVEIGWCLDGQLSFVTVVATTFWAFHGVTIPKWDSTEEGDPQQEKLGVSFGNRWDSKEILFITWNLHQGFGGFQTW